MDRNAYASADYRQPTIPPATPPVIDRGADPDEAARLPHDNGDSDAPGSQPAHVIRGQEDERLFDGAAGGGGDRDFPGEQPDEIVPDQGDNAEPGGTPDEFAPGQGDYDQPDNAPVESPPLPDTGPAVMPPPD